MNIIRDKVLYSSESPGPEEESTQRFFYRLLEELREELAETGDRTWILDTETGDFHPISAIEPTARRVASALTKLGFGPGDTVHTGYSSNLDFYWPVFGAWWCGGRASLADPNLAPELISVQLEDTHAKVVVCSKQYVQKYSDIISDLSKEGTAPLLFVLDATDDDVLPDNAASFGLLLRDDGQDAPSSAQLPPYDPQEAAVVFWSSGSTGVPKGILHSHHTLNIMPASRGEVIERALMTNIQFHIGGFLFNLLLGISGRAVCHFVKENCFTAARVLDLVEIYRPDYLICGVSHFMKISNLENTGRRFPGLKLISPMGGAISPGVSRKVLSLLGSEVTLKEMYGSTEIGFIATAKGHELQLGFLGQVGARNQVYIQDIKTGEKLGPNREGKIMARTPTMMLGFLNRPEQTREFFSEDGFGYTGDVGYYDESGQFFYSYRMKDAMKVDNYWFGPGEIEEVLESVPEIHEVGVWGEYNPDTGNELINAAVVLSKSANGWDDGKIREYVKSRLPPTRQITGKVYFLDSLPHSPQAKKLRGQIREIVNRVEE